MGLGSLAGFGAGGGTGADTDSSVGDCADGLAADLSVILTLAK